MVDFKGVSICASLNSIAPVKKKTKPIKRLALCNDLNTRKIKQKTHKLKKKWCFTKVEELRIVWQDSLKVYRKALR